MGLFLLALFAEISKNLKYFAPKVRTSASEEIPMFALDNTPWVRTYFMDSLLRTVLVLSWQVTVKELLTYQVAALQNYSTV